MATAKKTTAATRPAARPAAKKAVAKPAVKAAPAKAPLAAAPAPKAEKPRKPKLVRDSFTIPKAEYVVLDALKARAARLESPAKKSELLRAGIKALADMADKAFVQALAQVPAIKTGRPGKD